MPKRAASSTNKSSNKRQAKSVTSNKRKAPSSSKKTIDTTNDDDVEKEESINPPTKRKATRDNKNKDTNDDNSDINLSPKPTKSTTTKAKSTSKSKSSTKESIPSSSSSSGSSSSSSNSSSSSSRNSHNSNTLSGVIVGAPSFHSNIAAVAQVASQRVVEEIHAKNKNSKKHTPKSTKKQSNKEGPDADYIDEATIPKTSRRRIGEARQNNPPTPVIMEQPLTTSSSSSSSSSKSVFKTQITEKNASLLYLIVLGLCAVISFLMPYATLPSGIGIERMAFNTNNNNNEIKTEKSVEYSNSASITYSDTIGKILDFDELQTEMHDRHMEEIVTIRIHTEELLTQAARLLTPQNDSAYNYSTAWLYDAKRAVDDIYDESKEMETDLIIVGEEVDKEVERMEEKKSNVQTLDTPRVISAVKELKKWMVAFVDTLHHAGFAKNIELTSDLDLDLDTDSEILTESKESSTESTKSKEVNDISNQLEESLREPEKFTAFIEKMIDTTSSDLDNILQGIKPVESTDSTQIQMIQLKNNDSDNEEKFLQDRVKFIDETVSKVRAMIVASATTTMDYASILRGGKVWVGRLPPQFSGSNNFYPATSASLASSLNYIGKVRYTTQLKGLGHSPTVMIDMKPVTSGECYAISGKSGSITLILSENIILHGITIAHAASNDALPFIESSAMKSFTLSGWTEKPDTITGTAGTKIHYGDYIFEPMESTSAYHRAFKVNQPTDTVLDDTTFEVAIDSKHVSEPIRSVSIDFNDNHGNDDYTCIYKVRVFGVPASSVSHKKGEQNNEQNEYSEVFQEQE